MNITILETDKLYEELLTLPVEARSAFFSERLIQPFHEALARVGMPGTPEALGCLPLSGHDAEMAEMRTRLQQAEAWANARRTLETASKRFEDAGVPVPDHVVLGIFLGNPAFLAHSEGYTGFGSVPGFIQIVIAPNEVNLPKLDACIAHEFHHNVLFHNARWNFMEVSLAQYLAVEGLAESFATSLYGEESLGPWVTSVQGDDLERSRRIIGNKLDVTGFMEVRKYIFGDHPMMPQSESVGIPYCGGYAVGYWAVQAFLNKTGIPIEEATLIDGARIMRESGYFEV